MIYGLTHNADNVPVQRLAVAFKVSIGIPGSGSPGSHPEKLDHFRIVSKNPKGDWVENVEITSKLIDLYTRVVEADDGVRRTKLTEFDIVFLQDPSRVVLPDGTSAWSMDNVFRTEMAWWTSAERRCFGDGVKAWRNVSALPEKERAQHANERMIAWTPCGDVCPQCKSGECKPNGVLSFIFKDHPVIGSIVQFKTTSYESIARIMSSLMQIAEFTGGRLRGIPLKMVLRSGTTRYEGTDGKKKKGTAYFVNIEFREEDYKKLIPTLVAESSNYSRSLGNVRLIEEVDEEDVIETTVVDNLSDVAGSATATVMEEKFPDTALNAACSVYELNAAQKDALVNLYKGDKKVACEWMLTFNGMASKSGKTPAKIREIFTRALLQPGAVSQMLAEPDPPASTGKRTRTVKADPAATPAAAPTANPSPSTTVPTAQPTNSADPATDWTRF